MFFEGSDAESESQPNATFSELNSSIVEKAKVADLIFAGSTPNASMAVGRNSTPSPVDILHALMDDGSDVDSESDLEPISAAQVRHTLLTEDHFDDDHLSPSISTTDIRHVLLADDSSDGESPRLLTSAADVRLALLDADDSDDLPLSVPSNQPRWTAADFESYPDPDAYIMSESDGSS
jgi:hypothetical protein